MIANLEKNFISAVVYVHNDQQTIGYFLRQLSHILQKNFERYEIVCVNDASDDNSAEVIKECAGKLEHCVLSVVHMGFYQGREAAMNAGIDFAIGDFVYEFDSNYMDYPAETILEVYRRSLQGYDVVAAGSAKSRLSSSLFYRVFNRVAQQQYDMRSETFRMLSRRAINRIHSMSRAIPYRKALYANCGLQMDRLVYTPEKPAPFTRSRQKKKERQDTALNALILFTDVAYRLCIFFTILLMIATLGSGVYTVVVFLSQQPVAGFTTIMLVMTGSFFGVFAILSMILKYLSVVIDLIFKKQAYIVRSVEKVTNGPQS